MQILKKKKMAQCQWRTKGGGLGGFNPPPLQNSESPPKLCKLNLIWKLLKIAEFGAPTPQDVQKKGTKILKLPRFAIVLH